MDHDVPAEGDGDAAGTPGSDPEGRRPGAGGDAPAGGLASRIDQLMAEAELDDEPDPEAGGDDSAASTEELETLEAVEELSVDDVSIEAEVPVPLPRHDTGRSRPVVVVPPPVARGAPPPPPRIPTGRMPSIPGGRPGTVAGVGPAGSVPSGRMPSIPGSPPPRPVVRVPPIAGAGSSAPSITIPPVTPAEPEPDEPQHAEAPSSVVRGEFGGGTDTGVIDISDAVVESGDAIAIDDDPAADPAARPPPPPVPTHAPQPVDDEPSQAVVVADIAIETQLESPTVVERALADLGEAGHERRAEELTRAIELAVAAGADRTTVAGLSYELGELYERRLADEARAVKAFGKALSTDPSLRPNLWAIRRIFYRRGLWPNLHKLLDAELRFARGDAERADLLFEKGLLLRDRLDQPADAKVAFEESSRLEPRLLAPLIALERMAIADGELPRAAELWEQLAVAARSPERKLVHLLDLIRYHGEQGEAGLDRARELITEAVALGVDGPRVADERLRLAELSGEPDEILAALESQALLLSAQAGPAGLPDARDAPAHARPPGTPLDRATGLRLSLAALRRRQAQVARAAKLGERAWDYLQAALTAAPGEPLLLADLADLAEELGRFEELAELVQSWQSLEGDPSRAVTLSIRRADALLRGGRREAARALLTSLEASTPGFLPLTALAERDALASSDWAALAGAWQRAAEAARLGTLLGVTAGPAVAGEPFGGGHAGAGPDPMLAASLYVAAAEVWAHDVAAGGAVDAGGEARTCLGLALEVVRGYPPAVEALVELHEQAGRIEEAAAVLELQAESPASIDIDARVQILARLARLYRDHGHYEQALGAEQRLRRLLPDDVRLMWQIDVTLAQLGRAEERIANLVAIASRDPDPARKGIALATAARLAEDAGDRDRAIDLYRQVLVAWPAERYARAALVELLRAQERWSDLVAQRRAEAAELSDGPGLVRALREAAWVLEERLARPGDAAGVYAELLERVPDEANAALGLVRCRIAAGDPLGLVSALESRLETFEKGSLHGAPDSFVAGPAPASLTGSEATAVAGAAVALAMAHESAGHADDAIDTYRRALAAVEGTSASDPGARSAAALAALALADVATARADTVGRIDAYRALITATGSARIAAALHEDLGWLHALVLEDFDRASEAFAAAAAADPTCRGPLIGRLLVSSRRGDSAGVAEAAAALAEVSTMPEAAAALHLRAAAIRSAAGGDLAAVAASIARARTVAPDDVGALVVAAAHAPAALPPRSGQAPEEVAAAVDQLLAQAEVFALRAQLADDPVARASWELDRAEALEMAGRLKEAGSVVAGVLRSLPGDFRALEALRRLARRGGDLASFARATVALARRMIDPTGRAELLREAAAVFDPNRAGNGPAVDAGAAVAIYKRMLVDDPGAAEFDRLVALYRGAGDIRGLHVALDERIAWIDRSGGDPAAAVPLLLERARLRKGLGNSRGAVGDLDDLLRRDPRHAEALRQCAELVVTLGEAPRGVELWQRYLAAETVADRKASGELALAKVLSEDMGDAAGAIVQLERVLAGNPDDATLRERLIGLATRVNDWHKVARELRELARLRTSPGDRAREESRLAEVQRDKLGDKGGARQSLTRARGYDPLNLEIIGQLVQITDDPPARARLLTEISDELRAAIEQAPARPALYERLGAVANWQRDGDTAYWSAAAVEALGTPTPEHRVILNQGRATPPTLSRHLIEPARRGALRPAAATGLLADLWRAIAPAVTASQGLDAAKLGFVRADRQALKSLGKRFDALASVLAMFGVDDVEIYVSEQRYGMARVLSGETPIVCLGADVAAGAAPQSRYWLGRSAMLAAEGTGTLVELKEAEVSWYLAAAARAIEAPVPPALAEVMAADGAAITERTRLLQKHLARRDKKALGALAPRLATLTSAADLASWRRAALTVGHRAGLLCAGDLAPVLAAIDVRGARAIADSPHAADLLAWSVSSDHLELRRQLGYARGHS